MHRLPLLARRAFLALALVSLTAAATMPAPSAILMSEYIDRSPPYPQAHASTIVELPDGTLAASWFGGSGEGRSDVQIWFARRTPKGWEKPVAVASYASPHGAGGPTWNPVLFQPPGAPLQLFYKIGPSPRAWQGVVITSPDGGRHWSNMRLLPDGILGPIKNKPVALPDGTWLSPSSREVGTPEKNRWFLRMERSEDAGRTWTAGPEIPSPVGLEAIQPSVLTSRDGTLALVARTRQGVLATSRSRDAGRTWSPLAALELPNPNAGTDAVTLADGRQLLVYNHAAHDPATPGDGPRWPLNVALSDDGVHWRAVLTLENRPIKDGYAYPAVIQTRDGLVHVTYTWNRTHIRHTVIDPRRLR